MADWTYYSTHHFFEASAGDWTLSVLDRFPGNDGTVLQASLIIDGVPIVDSDADGLDDNWELAHFGTLAYGPKDDPDDDGYNNAREQVMGTDPLVPVLRQAHLSPANQVLTRLSWPSVGGET